MSCVVAKNRLLFKSKSKKPLKFYMPKSLPKDKKPNLPQKDAVKRLRERFKKRKSEITPSTEMNEILGKKKTDRRK